MNYGYRLLLITLIFFISVNAIYADATKDFGVAIAALKSGNYDKALTYFNKAGEQGHVEAQYIVGVMYDKGVGVLENDKEAVKWYTKAAEQGNADALLNLGIMYATGQGVLKNEKEAYAWFLIASYMGSTNAKSALEAIKNRLDNNGITNGQERARELLDQIENKSKN